MTLKNNVMFDYISKEDYKNAGLEETYVDGISITGYNVEGGLDVVIPSMINDKKVIEIGDYAFTHSGIIPTTISNTKKVVPSYLYNIDNKKEVTLLNYQSIGLGITSVVIPNTVTSIGVSAFENNQLTEVTIPSSVTNIMDEAFMSNQLTSITLSDGVTSIGNRAFENNQLIEVVIPSSVTSIGWGAFAKNQGTTITNNSIIENSSDVWNEIVSGATACHNFYVDSITDNVIKISQNEGVC